jgi:hypothetical protein
VRQLLDKYKKLITEQRDIDKKPKSPSAAPLPVGCVANGGMIVNFTKCITNNNNTQCCATLNNTTPSTSNIGERVELTNATPPGWYEVNQVINPDTHPTNNLAMLCAPNMGTPINYDTLPPGPCPPPPSWDCLFGGCQDPGDGSGQYSSHNTCQVACTPCDPIHLTNAFPAGFIPQTTVGYCRACGLLGNNPNQNSIYTQGYGFQPSDSSPNPNFATLDDVCIYIDTNSCC